MAVLCAFLATACGFDYYKRRIPNCLVVIMAAVGPVLRWRKEGIGGLLAFAGGAIIIMALLYPFFKVGAVGAGDIKLFGVTAGFLPFHKILYFSFVSLLVAAIFSIIKLIYKKCLKERLCILLAYLKNVMNGGEIGIYPAYGGEKDRVSICLSGPVLISVLLLLGGAY